MSVDQFFVFDVAVLQLGDRLIHEDAQTEQLEVQAGLEPVDCQFPDHGDDAGEGDVDFDVFSIFFNGDQLGDLHFHQGHPQSHGEPQEIVRRHPHSDGHHAHQGGHDVIDELDDLFHRHRQGQGVERVDRSVDEQHELSLFLVC